MGTRNRRHLSPDLSVAMGSFDENIPYSDKYISSGDTRGYRVFEQLKGSELKARNRVGKSTCIRQTNLVINSQIYNFYYNVHGACI